MAAILIGGPVVAIALPRDPSVVVRAIDSVVTPRPCPSEGYPAPGVIRCLAPVPVHGRNTLFGGFCPGLMQPDREPKWGRHGAWVGPYPVCELGCF